MKKWLQFIPVIGFVYYAIKLYPLFSQIDKAQKAGDYTLSGKLIEVSLDLDERLLISWAVTGVIVGIIQIVAILST